MTANPNLMSAEADVLRCGYNVGYFEKPDIARWADRQIATLEDPCAELLDLSMSRQTHPVDVMKLLQSLGAVDSADAIETQIGFIGLLYEEQKIDTQLAIRGLFALVHEPDTTDHQRSQIYYLDDGYDLAVAGTYGTTCEIERDLKDFMSPYAERLTEQYPQFISSTRMDLEEQKDEREP